ncbi:type 2 lanthipeptide synthetase LanM [Halobacillus hunanensis]|uniref:type 2 lanthipeptide synthetase LanM n=1 Tax=Halobacillus hunanensis TaxID=578214 RepID=UPI0009A6851D|nr:type 2 lanthipeptide synthetase LanM [Halobacillus hunanensis]
MITYKKQFYPELEQSDFDEHIAPLLYYIDELSVHSEDNLNNVDAFKAQELYPYHNPCRMIARNALEKVWDSNLDKHLLEPESFKNAICELFSQIAFSYLIRCFAEQIKTLSEQSMNSKEIYDYYTQRLMATQFKEFADIYAIAWGRCNNLLENRANAIKDAIQLTEKHRVRIEEELKIPCTSRIASVQSGGDTHNNGTSVAIITFEHGEKIVFKPRSVSGELGYTNFIREINKFISPKMPSLTVIDFGNYGFTTFVETNEEKTDMFQAGRLACLMFMLNATDMHYSNILWTNEGPLPIDLETLFHPPRIRTGIPESKRSAYHALEKSVYGTGVLPISLGTKTGNGSVDVGFTGIRNENSVSPFKIFDIQNGFSSNIKVVWKHQSIDNTLSNDPDLESFIHERCDQIIEGFSEFFMQVYQQKNLFIDAVRKSFSNVNFRYIHNMTYRYEQILRILSDAEPSRDIETAHALLSRTGILSLTSDTNLVLSECRQLWNGDIPYFSLNFKGTEVFSGNEVISHIPTSPESQFISKMENLTKDDLIRQTNLIRLAFVAKLADPHADGKLKLEESESIEKEITKFKKLNTVKDYNNKNHKEIISWFSKSITESLLDDRYEHLPKTWIGPVARFGGQGWTPGVLGYDLYNGRVGPALALAVAGKLVSDDDAIKASNDIFEKSSNILEEKSFELRNVLLSGIGGFSGVSGLLWTLFAAGDFVGNEKWKDIAVNSWPILHHSLDTPDNDFFDMITGKSSSIVMRYRTQKDFKLSNDIIKRSLSLAYSKINASDTQTTSGLTHGYGQLLWFFALVNQKQENSEIKRIVEDIDSIICNKYTNNDGIIEIYKDGEGMNVSSSWCNGLSGLLIAYYEAYKSNILPKESVLNLIDQLRRIPISRVPVLCHGSLGIVEALEYVSESFPEETSEILLEMKTTFCSPEYIFNYYKNGKGRYPLSPGLMAGKAGALLHLCKSLDPTIKTSPLTFGN